MKVVVPVIVKDPEVSEWKGVDPTERVTIDTEEHLLDGPITPRVAVLDFDPKTGRLEPGVEFSANEDGEQGTYLVDEPFAPGASLVSRQAGAVSIFGTVFKTIRLFEEADALGRKITWGFGAPQLLVVPRAGVWPNAFYERESRSLQFFFFDEENRTVHTGHSQDIVAHETAHAILDGVAPDLYHAITPQSLAIHEAIADLTALLCSFRSEELAREVLSQTGGSIERSNAFTGIAEQFAGALHQQRNYLRELNNERSLRRNTHDRASSTEPHELSEVLSGALYKVLVQMYNELRADFDSAGGSSAEMVSSAEAEFSTAQARQYSPTPDIQIGPALKALFVAGERLKRVLYRGLDYVPPGDISFADLGQAILAADQASHPESGRPRQWLIEEFVKRGIVEHASELAVPEDVPSDSITGLDLDGLELSDWVAYDFVNRHRRLLGVPEDVTFEVRPRLAVERLYWHRDGKQTVREILLKVGWTEEEGQRLPGMPRRRTVARGSTLSIERPGPESGRSPRIRTVITTGSRELSAPDRTAFLRKLVDDGTLRLAEDAIGPHGRPLHNVIAGQILHGALRVKGTSRTLHLTQESRA